MPMNIVIQEKRKELGLTQEQVAEYLGVSIPAVSKWEKGTTSPDIGLLPSLARILKIDLNTLFCFHENLTLQEIGLFCNEITIIGQDDGLSAAFELAEAKFHEFPYDEELMVRVVICLDGLLLQSKLPDSEKEPFDEKISSWYTQLIQSSDSKISNSAKYMTVSRYIRQDKLELAQSVLDTVPDRNEITSAMPDKLMLQVSIYLKQDMAGLAATELERALLLALNRVQLLLCKLVDAELADGEKEKASAVAEKSFQMTELFDLWKYSGYVAPYQIATKEGDADKLVKLLAQMLEALTMPWELEESPLFYRIAPDTNRTENQRLLSMILAELETDPECDYLRENQEFINLIDKYRAK